MIRSILLTSMITAVGLFSPKYALGQELLEFFDSHTELGLVAVLSLSKYDEFGLPRELVVRIENNNPDVDYKFFVSENSDMHITISIKDGDGETISKTPRKYYHHDLPAFFDVILAPGDHHPFTINVSDLLLDSVLVENLESVSFTVRSTFSYQILSDETNDAAYVSFGFRTGELNLN